MTNPVTMTTYPAVLGVFLVKKRKELGLTQGELAEKVGLTVSSWSRIESGEAALTIEQLALAANAFSMSPGQLLMAIDTITAELSKKGIGTNIERYSSDDIAAAGSIPLVGAGLISTVNFASLSGSLTAGAGGLAAGAAAGAGSLTAGAGSLAAGAAAVAAGPLALPLLVGGAALGLYNWLSYKDKKDKA